MSMLFKRDLNDAAYGLPLNSAGGRVTSAAALSPAQALRSGAVWACLRLRADLISTMPMDVFRKVGGRGVEVPKPPILINPASRMLWHEWMYASEFDLGRYGNAFGFITARDGAGRPAQIELTDTLQWSVLVTGDGIEYRYMGQPVPTADVWHERSNVVAGLPVGLSPVAFSAWTTAHYLSAQQFALDWFESGASPSGTLKNVGKTLNEGEASGMKARFRAAISRRDVFVHGKDWEYVPAAGAASDAKFLEAMKSSTLDICRFYGVPGDMIDAESSTGSITYANVTQRNLQLLTMNIGPAITKRELIFSSRLMAAPRYAKFNTDAMLRMDARGKLETIATGVDSGLYTHDEGRALLELEPLTDEQIAKEAQIKGPVPVPGTKTGVPA